MMTMKSENKISLVFGSDFHFGIPSVNQEDMAEAFTKTIFPLLNTTDILFINGDFFDGLVIFDNHGFDPIYDVMMNLLHICEEKAVTLRVMQGTWSHDRNQCKRFETFYKNNKFTFNFKFINAIDLEEIPVGNRSIRVFYIPDNLPFKTSDDIVDVIRNKMAELGWDYVDYGCIHGFFDFTYPKNISQVGQIVYREAQFPFVRKIIDVGHVHQYRISGKVISNGSFDRLCFGDEDKKGCILVEDYPDKYKARFIENKYSAIYDTLKIEESLDTDDIRTMTENHISHLNTSRIISLRFLINSNEKYDAIKTWINETYKNIRCTRKKISDVDDTTSIINTSDIIDKVEQTIAPSPETIASYIRSYIPDDYILPIDKISEYLKSE